MRDSFFSLIEAPIYQGQKHFGVSLGPAFLRQLLLDQGYRFSTYPLAFQQSQLNINLEAYEELSYNVERESRRHNPLFIVGGDHSLSLGSVQGLLRCNPDLKVIWVDAHGDINTRESSATKAFHGMPLSFLLGADTVINEIKAEVAGAHVHFSVDADGFDPIYAPSTGIKVSYGLSPQIVSKLVNEVALTSVVRSLDFVELNPQIFQQTTDVFRTAQIGIDLFSQILKQISKKESHYGFNDRQRYSAKSDLFYTTI